MVSNPDEENPFFYSSKNNDFNFSEDDSIYRDEKKTNNKIQYNQNLTTNNIQTNYETKKQINEKNKNLIFENIDNSSEDLCLGMYDNNSEILDQENEYVKKIINNDNIEENYDKDEYFNKKIINNYNKEENINENNKNISEDKNKKKKKGKEKKQKNGRKDHSKFDYDNMRDSLKINLFNAIIIFFNKIVKKLFVNQTNLFKKINSIDKKVKSSISLKEQLTTKISDILKLPIQNNYKNSKLDNNKILMEKIENENKNQNFQELFSMTLGDFYKKIYLSNDKEQLIEQFGISKKEEFLFVDHLKNKILKESEDYINKYINMASNILKFAGIEEKNLDLNHFKMININNNLNHFNNNNDNLHYEIDNVRNDKCIFLNKKRN